MEIKTDVTCCVRCMILYLDQKCMENRLGEFGRHAWSIPQLFHDKPTLIARYL